MMAITLSTNALCNAAIRDSVLVRLESQDGEHLGDFGSEGLEQPDVKATVLNKECTVVLADPITLAGQLFLSLLKEGG